MFRTCLTIILLAVILAANNFAGRAHDSQTRERRTRDARVRQLITLTDTQKIVDIAFTTDGRFVATTSADQSKRWWNAETGVESTAPGSALADNTVARKPCAMYGDRDPFLAQLPNGKEFSAVSRSRDNSLLLTQKSVDESSSIYGWFTLQIWDTATAQLRMTSEKLRFTCAVYWNPDGESLIVVPYARNQTRLVDARTGRVKAKLTHEGCTGDSLFGGGGCEPWVFSSDGGLGIKQTSPIKIWNTKTGELITELKNTAPPAVFSPANSRVVATLSRDSRKVTLWEVVGK